MIGAVPAAQLAPLEYRCALDAALAVLGTSSPLLICRADELLAEVRQRLTDEGQPQPAAMAGLWVEPLTTSWRADLATFAGRLANGAPLLIVASQPLARRLPERKGWAGQPLGMRPGGIARLSAALRRAGFVIGARHGFHSAVAVGLHALSRRAERHGRPDLADQLHFAARLRYRSAGTMAAFATVALLVARREREP